jgi:hypothetical protein
VQVFIVVIDEVSWQLWVLNKPLNGVPGKEFAVRLFNLPIEFAKEFSQCRFGEKVYLTGENVKYFVLTGRNVSAAIE